MKVADEDFLPQPGFSFSRRRKRKRKRKRKEEEGREETSEAATRRKFLTSSFEKKISKRKLFEASSSSDSFAGRSFLGKT